MKITSIEIGEIFVPLVTPFKTALRTVENVEDIVICIHTDTDAVGYGEAPPTAVITGDTKGSIVTAIRDFIAPAITRHGYLGVGYDHAQDASRDPEKHVCKGLCRYGPL